MPAPVINSLARYSKVGVNARTPKTIYRSGVGMISRHTTPVPRQIILRNGVYKPKSLAYKCHMKKDDPIIMHFGESIGLWKLLGHYRLMARNARFPRDKALYRTLARTAIAQYREERKSA